MKIEIETINCTYLNPQLNEDINSTIIINLEIERIISSQSKNKTQLDVINGIKTELSKFTFLLTGVVLIDFVWFIDAQTRQETDRIGDIDNITKPILDSLIGMDSLLVDDSQIKALYTSWSTKNKSVKNNFLRLEIKYFNDCTIEKNNLFFIQYHSAICTPINIDFNDIQCLYKTKLVLNALTTKRKFAQLFNKVGVSNATEYLTVSNWDFHKTRLSAFSKQIIDIAKFNQLCKANGLTFAALRQLKLLNFNH